ncbi:hypothetical protein [Amycolatopsis sp. lyj-23]|uniref:hypothetical protein n=1 Tax=Amycolatopsis sp. lyj-23 TaxID=2789283 RepID=UPI00397BB893
MTVLVAKYDEAAHQGDVEDWTSNDDIGGRFAGQVLSPTEYYRVEDLYVDFVRALTTACGVTEFVIRAPMMTKSLPPWVPVLRSGLVVDSETALKLVRRMLRIGDVSCVLCAGDALTLSVETDFYLSVQADEGKIAESALRFGLHVYQTGDWAWFEMDDGVLGTLGDRFLPEVQQLCSTGRSIILLERWANGPGGERWHLLDGAGPLDWTLQRLPGTAVAALPDTRIKWTPRRGALPDISVELGDEEPVVVVARPQADVGSALEVVVFLGGVRHAEEADLPLGGELGWFAYPDIGGSAGHSLAGVIPDWDGRVDALWDPDLTLIR